MISNAFEVDEYKRRLSMQVEIPETTTLSGKLFIKGTVAGTVIILLGALATIIVGGPESKNDGFFLFSSEVLGTAVAAAYAAKERKATSAIIALICAFFIYFVVGYIFFVSFISQINKWGGNIDFGRPMWGIHFTVSLLTIPIGSLIGTIFGQRTRYM